MTFKKGDSNLGRPKGSVTRKTKLTDIERKQLAAAAGGISPLEFAASILRDVNADMKDKKWACELLMPYMHRKLPTAIDLAANTVVTTVNAESLAKLSTKDLDKLLTMVMAIVDVHDS